MAVPPDRSSSQGSMAKHQQARPVKLRHILRTLIVYLIGVSSGLYLCAGGCLTTVGKEADVSPFAVVPSKESFMVDSTKMKKDPPPRAIAPSKGNFVKETKVKIDPPPLAVTSRNESVVEETKVKKDPPPLAIVPTIKGSVTNETKVKRDAPPLAVPPSKESFANAAKLKKISARLAAANDNKTKSPFPHNITKGRKHKTKKIWTLDEKGRKVFDKHEARLKDLRLPTPIMVMGMMKAGTTSIFGYFRCGLRKKFDGVLSHYDCRPGLKQRWKTRMSCGKRLRMNVNYFNKSAFDAMDQFALYAELDAQELNEEMTLPQYQFLPEIHEQFPNSTWILNLRDPEKWLGSIDKWQDLRQRFIDSHFGKHLPKGKGKNDTDMLNFYKIQAQRVRDFVREHPSHKLIEVQIDHQDAGQVMQDAFGISSSECWGNRNVNAGDSNWEMLTANT
jgi:hypothetical protein